MNINRFNFLKEWSSIEKFLRKSDMIALDFEFTGLGERNEIGPLDSVIILC